MTGIEETGGTGADPLDNGWQYGKKITILASEVADDLTNFPVLIRTTDPEWADTSNGGYVAQSDGGDILFTAGDRTTKLDHEIEKYNPATGELVAWVEVRSLSASEDTNIYIFYGNADAVDQWNPTGAGVWEPNFVGVWHLRETSGQHHDSTWNSNDSSEVTVTTQGSAMGQIGGADYLNGSVAGVKIDDNSSLDITQQITIEAWVKADSCYRHRIVNKQDAFVLRADTLSGECSDHLNGYLNGATNVARSECDIIQNPASNYQHVVFKWDGRNGYDNTLRLYNDGTEVTYYGTPDTYQGTIDVTTTDLWIGSYGTGGVESWDGEIDEVRISKVARSAAWIETEHNNQKTSSTFYVIDDGWVGSCWSPRCV